MLSLSKHQSAETRCASQTLSAPLGRPVPVVKILESKIVTTQPCLQMQTLRERFLSQTLKVFAAKQNHHLQKSAHKTSFS
jgi:hypothetical protein